MVVPFGVSVGDFISGINFIRELSKALKDSAGSRHDYCELLCELESLEKAFVLVKDIKVDEALQAQKDEVARAALQCQGTILRFLIQIDKFKFSLSPGRSSNRWYDVLRKCQWVLKKEDVQKLRAQIQSHIASIGLGMVTLQINSMSLHPQAQNQGSPQCCTHGTQITNLGLSVSENTALLSDMLTDFGKSVSNNADLLSSLKDLVPTLRQMIAVQQPPEEFKIMSAKIHDTYQVVSEMRQSLSVQIDRPSFYFLDACGVTATFDLAFFDNWDIFEIAIAAKFKERGLQVVAKKKYVLEDAHRKTSIDRTRGFKALFLPGRQINMDACFDDREALGTSCPICRHIEYLASNEGIDCSKCRTHYKRIEEIVAPNSTGRPMPSYRRKRKASELEDDNSSINDEIEDDISMYSRIRLRSIKLIEPNVKKAKMEQISTVLCEQCNTWQHILCYYPQVLVPDLHLCVVCKPSSVLRQGTIGLKTEMMIRIRNRKLIFGGQTPAIEQQTSEEMYRRALEAADQLALVDISEISLKGTPEQKTPEPPLFDKHRRPEEARYQVMPPALIAKFYSHSDVMAPIANTPKPPATRQEESSETPITSPNASDESWTKISDLAERRRIQNRITQRNFRKKLKKRLEDLERRARSSSPGYDIDVN